MILRQSYLIQNTRLVKMQLKLYISKLTFNSYMNIIFCASVFAMNISSLHFSASAWLHQMGSAN